MIRVFFVISLLVHGLSALDKPATYPEVQAILNNKCISCHGAEKDKAELRLDGLQYILKGSSNGPVLKMGNPHASSMYTRAALPDYHDDHMPSKGESLTELELMMMASWIRGKVVAERKAPPARERSAGNNTGSSRSGASAGKRSAASTARALSLPAASQAGIAKLTKIGAIVDILDESGSLLGISLHSTDRQGLSSGLAAVRELGSNVIQLDLGRSVITDGDLEVLSSLKNLEVLSLYSTSVSDKAIGHIKGRKNLTMLNLADTKVGDKGLKGLEGLSLLTACYVWSSSVSKKGAKSLADAIPGCDVNVGE